MREKNSYLNLKLCNNAKQSEELYVKHTIGLGKAAVSGLYSFYCEARSEFSAQELNLGSLDENQESQPPDQQGLEARSCFFPGYLLLVRNAFITEAETTNAGTQFNHWRHSTATSAHRDTVCLVKTEATWREKVWAAPSRGEEQNKR